MLGLTSKQSKSPRGDLRFIQRGGGSLRRDSHEPIETHPSMQDYDRGTLLRTINSGKYIPATLRQQYDTLRRLTVANLTESLIQTFKPSDLLKLRYVTYERYVTLRYVTNVTSRYVRTLHYVMLRTNVTLRYVQRTNVRMYERYVRMLRYVRTLRTNVTLRYVTLCYVTLRYV